MKELVRYLLENMTIDFQGVSLDQMRSSLREDDGKEARQVLAKLIEDKGEDEMLLALCDVLKDHIATGVNEKVLREQVLLYAES